MQIPRHKNRLCNPHKHLLVYMLMVYNRIRFIKLVIVSSYPFT